MKIKKCSKKKIKIKEDFKFPELLSDLDCEKTHMLHKILLKQIKQRNLGISNNS